MAPKKKSNNGYMAFMLELARKMSRADAEKEAARTWPFMTQAQRAPYQGRPTNAIPKMNCLRENINSVQIQEKNLELQDRAMSDDIKSHISSITGDAGVYNEYFQILHINHHFVTTENVCYPAEIGIVRFNLNEGVIDENVFHSIIKPGKFPIGYLGTAKAKSESVHKIPYAYADVLPDNKDQIIRSVFLFLSETAKLNGQGNVLPPLYVREDFRKEVASAITQMADRYGYDAAQLRVYNLSLLLFHLRNDIRNKAAWPTITQSNNELNNDAFDYTSEIACEFHKGVDAPLHCSRAHAIRMAYIICDNCCPDLDITLIPGRHVPLDARADEATSTSFDNEDYMIRASDYAESMASVSARNDDSSEYETSSMTDRYDSNWEHVRSHRRLNFKSPPSSVCSSSNTYRDPTDWPNNAHSMRGRGRSSFRRM